MFIFYFFVYNVSESNLAKIKEQVTDTVSAKLLLGYLSVLSRVQFIMPEVLKNKTDKLLYVCSDVLCLNSIYSLYDTELGNNIVVICSI